MGGLFQSNETLPMSASTAGPDGLTDAQRTKNVKDSGYTPPEPTEEDKAAQAAAKANGNNAPLLGAAGNLNDAKKALQSPTLTDILMRDLASGQVRTLRKGGRRGTFSGGAMSPYGELPPLGS